MPRRLIRIDRTVGGRTLGGPGRRGNLVVKDGQPPLSADDVIGHVKSRLAGFKVPKRVEFVAELPKNSAGKILKRSLRQA